MLHLHRPCRETPRQRNLIPPLDWMPPQWTLTQDFVWGSWPWVKSKQNVISPPLCFFLSAHSDPVTEGWWGGDGEQKCHRDIKQSASVCALKVQPVWFPSSPSLPLFLPLRLSSINVSPRSNIFILFSPNLQISLSLLLYQHSCHFSADPSGLPLPFFGLL